MEDTRLEKINIAALKFLSPLSSETMYKTIVDEAKGVFDAQYGSIFLEKDGVLERVYADAEYLFKVNIRSNGNTYTTYKKKIPYVVPVSKIKNFHKPIKNNNIASIIHIPLSYKNEAIGVLTLHSHEEKQLSKQDTSILTLFGSMASLAIRKMQLITQTEAALETRDSFISLASHELRTPLTSISGYIQLLHKRMHGQNNAESKWVDELYIESNRMTNLIMELLEINRIKQGQLMFVFHEANMSSIVRSAIEEIHQKFPKRKILFTNNDKYNDVIIGDRSKLQKVIFGLLSNAVKFSPTNSTISIDQKGSKKFIIVQIKDSGSGINRENIEKIFDGFYKEVDNHKEGLALGLLLAKHIIKSHKGEIDVESERNKGTVVEVKLPRAKL